MVVSKWISWVGLGTLLLVAQMRADENPEWTAAVGEAQLDSRMIVGTSDGGAHLALVGPESAVAGGRREGPRKLLELGRNGQGTAPPRQRPPEACGAKSPVHRASTRQSAQCSRD